MRRVSRSLQALAALVAVTAHVAGCSGGAASSTPLSSPLASPSALPSVAAGSASSSARPTTVPTQRTIQSPDPSFYVVEVICEGVLDGCSLHRTNEAGIEAPGFPMELEGTLVDIAWNDFTIGCGSSREPLVRDGFDDLTFVGLVGPSGNAEIHAFHSSGFPANGWPQPFPAPDGECHGFMLDPTGERLIAWGYSDVEQDMTLVADRTEFTIFERNGTTRPGWPRGSEGAASGPVWLEEGLAYVSASGRVWAHDASGEVRPGWGYQLPTKEAPLSFGTRLTILQPSIEDDDAVIAIGLDGQPAPGYPVDLGADIESRCLFGDTPCAGLVGPTMAPDESVFVALGNGHHEVQETGTAGGRIVAFAPTGELIDGWPVQLPERTHATRIGWSSEGAIVAQVVVCAPNGCGEVEREELLWYALDGNWIEELTSPVPGD